MPPNVEIRDARYTLEITCAAAPVFRNGYLDAFYDQLDAWHAALPLATVVWKALPPDGVLLPYELKGTAVDGRVWKITAGLTPGVEETVWTFDVADRFTLAEFEPQRLLRLTLVALTRAYGVTLVEVTWV